MTKLSGWGWRSVLAFTVISLVACSDTPVAPEAHASGEPAILFAKGGGKPPAPPPPIPAIITIHDQDATGGPTDLRTDGRGPYVDAVCGVHAEIRLRDDGQWGTNMRPTMYAPEPSCGGPRQATLRVAVRHLSDDPHVDDTSAVLGEAPIDEYGIVLDAGSVKINAPPLCFLVSKSGKVSGRGLRLDPAQFPGSNSVMVTPFETPLGTGYRIQTQPFPNNVAWCEDNNGISFWHVVLDLEVQPKG